MQVDGNDTNPILEVHPCGEILLPAPPGKDMWQFLQLVLVFTAEGVLLAHSESRPEMLLNILQFTRQPHTSKKDLALPVHSTRFEKRCPSLRG